jgi:hypothetical protein
MPKADNKNAPVTRTVLPVASQNNRVNFELPGGSAKLSPVRIGVWFMFCFIFNHYLRHQQIE